MQVQNMSVIVSSCYLLSTILISSSLNLPTAIHRPTYLSAIRGLDLTFHHRLLLWRATSSPKFRTLEFGGGAR
jgi:hypothetical protein